MPDADGFGAQGGDLRSLGPGDWLDLSTCVNPYGPAPAATAALDAADATRLLKHPYASEQHLRDAYAEHLGVPGEDLVVGRGTTEFLWSLSRRWNHSSAAVPLPAYTDFLRAFPGRGARSRSRVVTAEDVDRLMNRARLVILSNPSNPTGTLIPPAELAACCARHPAATLVVDESYVEFLADPRRGTLVGASPQNLMVLRSPSKFYGIAGARTGVAWTRDASRREALERGRGPWPVSALDAELAIAALRDERWAADVRRRLLDDAGRLETLLVDAGGAVETSDVHYRLWYATDARVAEALRGHGIAVRVLGASHGFDAPVVRVTAPPEHQFDHLATAIRAIVAA
jgi:histidinol-phosphate aminotransferase